MSADGYHIASLKNTYESDAHIRWWAHNHRGYTPVAVGERIGFYTKEEAEKLNDGIDFIAVHSSIVQRLLSPAPQYKPGCWNFDEVGPVVKNNRANWNYLNAGRIPVREGDRDKIKPTYMKKKDTLLYPEADPK